MRDGRLGEETVEERGRGGGVPLSPCQFVYFLLDWLSWFQVLPVILPTVLCPNSCLNTSQLQCLLCLFPSHPPCSPPPTSNHLDFLTSTNFLLQRPNLPQHILTNNNRTKSLCFSFSASSENNIVCDANKL